MSSSATSSSPPPVVFLFSGQGSQYPNMGADLYASEPVFRDCLDACAEQFQPHLGLDLREILYPNAQKDAVAAEQLNRTDITQPALFSLEYSLAQWWIAHGVRPQAMVGHSIGEYVAACLADVLSLEDAIAVTAIRGRLMQDCEPGSMLASRAFSGRAHPVGRYRGLARVQRAPISVSFRDRRSQSRRWRRAWQKRGVFCRKLQTSQPFHSSMMDPILGAFIAQMRRVTAPAAADSGAFVQPHRHVDHGRGSDRSRVLGTSSSEHGAVLGLRQ